VVKEGGGDSVLNTHQRPIFSPHLKRHVPIIYSVVPIILVFFSGKSIWKNWVVLSIYLI